jgi:hypothetical protein
MAGTSGQSMPVLVVCILEFKCRGFDFFFTECTPRFLKSLLCSLLGDEWHVESVVCSPHEMGKPVRRNRFYSFCYDASKWHFFGTPGNFRELFCKKSLRLTCDVFFEAPPDQVEAGLKKVVSESMVEAVKGQPATFADCFSLGQRRNLEGFRARRTSKIEDGQLDKDTPWVCDIAHNPLARPRCGVVMPCLITHGIMYNVIRERPLLPEEHLSVMGVPVWPGMRTMQTPLSKQKVTYESPLDLTLFNSSKIKRFAGNGMDFLALGAWVAYCFGNAAHLVAHFVACTCSCCMFQQCLSPPQIQLHRGAECD